MCSRATSPPSFQSKHLHFNFKLNFNFLSYCILYFKFRLFQSLFFFKDKKNPKGKKPKPNQKSPKQNPNKQKNPNPTNQPKNSNQRNIII